MRARSHQLPGRGPLVAHATRGSTTSKTLMLDRCRQYGDLRLLEVTEERNGPSGLRDNDDDVLRYWDLCECNLRPVRTCTLILSSCLFCAVISLFMSTAMFRRFPIIPLTATIFSSISSSRASSVILSSNSHKQHPRNKG